MNDNHPRLDLEIAYTNKDGSTQRYKCIGLNRRRAIWISWCSDCGRGFTVSTEPTRRAVKHRLGGLFATRCAAYRRQDRVKPSAQSAERSA